MPSGAVFLSEVLYHFLRGRLQYASPALYIGPYIVPMARSVVSTAWLAWT